MENQDETSMESMCRACLEPMSKKYPLTGNIINLEVDIASMLEFCTSKKLDLNDSLPDSVCISCFKTIRIAYRFLKQFCEVQDQLKSFIIKEETFFFEVESSTQENIFNSHNYPEQTIDDENSQELMDDPFEVNSDSESEVKIGEQINLVDSDEDSTQFLDPDYEEEKPDFTRMFNLQGTNSDQSKIELVVDNTKTEDFDEKLYRYICPICSKKFCRAEKFYSHILEYKLTKITCTRCPSKPEYDTREYFKHYKEFHRYHCDICGKKLVSSYGHHYHMKQHNCVRRYKCHFNGCERSFIMKHLLRKHMKCHSKGTSYLCQLCSSTFKTNDALRYHLKIHDNKKDHLCTICGRAFFQAVHLRDHMYRHMGIKKFICDICGKCFTTNSSLKKHIVYCTKRRDTHEVFVHLAMLPKCEENYFVQNDC